MLLFCGDTAQACGLIGVVTSRLTYLTEVMIDMSEASGDICVIVVLFLSNGDFVFLVQDDYGFFV